MKRRRRRKKGEVREGGEGGRRGVDLAQALIVDGML
jgi:hypothetical protein